MTDKKRPCRKTTKTTLSDPNLPGLTRRSLLAGAAGVAAGAVGLCGVRPASAAVDSSWKITNGRINQSVCSWCFEPMKLETLARHAAAIGLKSVELVDPKDWPVLKKYGLICAITPSHMFVRGMNNPKYHPECLAALKKSILATSEAGFPNVITFSGFKENLTDEEGIANTVAGLKKIIGLAEKKKVNLCIEVLNTRVHIKMKGHPGYQCDRVEWAAEVCRKVGSPRMKILFDIYHVQIMQGDVITRLRKYKDYIGHYHTAGNPGRNDLDDTQEIHYPGIMNAIAETGYTGYVGQEFIPKAADEPGQIAALRSAAKLGAV